jgi:RimJ/RimL family protein N-acetyltransferase
MSQNDPTVADEARAFRTLAVHFSMQLGCAEGDFQRPGWTTLCAAGESDPLALLFGQRQLLQIVAPASPLDGRPGRSGIVSVAPVLRPALAGLLREYAPEALFTTSGLDALDALVRAVAPQTLTARSEAHLRLRYATRARFRPYFGQWVEWIESLDESSETDLIALGLLARYSSVYVIRQRGAIASFAGIRMHSPHVAEIGVRTDAEALRGQGLGRAVVSRATRAILDTARIPLYRHRADNPASEHLARALGYRFYAESVQYFALSD